MIETPQPCRLRGIFVCKKSVFKLLIFCCFSPCFQRFFRRVGPSVGPKYKLFFKCRIYYNTSKPTASKMLFSFGIHIADIKNRVTAAQFEFHSHNISVCFHLSYKAISPCPRHLGSGDTFGNIAGFFIDSNFHSLFNSLFIAFLHCLQQFIIGCLQCLVRCAIFSQTIDVINGLPLFSQRLQALPVASLTFCRYFGSSCLLIISLPPLCTFWPFVYSIL